jgi:endonuclease/exonuclease/phosphatase family metal-dependent hydrolase
MASVTLRVATFNVRGLRDDRAAVVHVLREAGADVVALQEPPRGPLGRVRTRRLAEAAGLEVAVRGGGARTTALLVRPGLQVTLARSMRLPWHPGRTRRGLSIVDVAGVRVISVHFSLSATERSGHLVRLMPVVRAAPGAGCIVAGDLNERPGGPVWRRLGQSLRDLTAGAGPTYPAADASARIDAVLGTGGLVATGARVIDDDLARVASDHLAVVVDVRWP